MKKNTTNRYHFFYNFIYLFAQRGDLLFNGSLFIYFFLNFIHNPLLLF